MLEENTQNIASALRNAILNLGKIPKFVYLDNGRAFKGKYFTGSANFNETGLKGIYEKLGITTIFANPYNARAKVIERFFLEMQESFEKLLPSYIGTGIENKPDNISKISLIYGEAGLGKTKAALYLSIKHGAIYIRATNKMNTKWFLEELASELEEIPRFYTADIFRQCVNALKTKPQMIIVDEIDYLLSDFRTFETLRDLHDETGVPIILVGMNLARHKLKKHNHLFDRISEVYNFTEFEYSDIKQIVEEISEVDITKEVISIIHQKAKSFRKIVEMIDMFEKVA